jgi:hypothetical protein
MKTKLTPGAAPPKPAHIDTTEPEVIRAEDQVHADLCERCGKDASHKLCPMRDNPSTKDVPCDHCGAPVYYSFGAKMYAHEGRKPSLSHRLQSGSDWGKWAECENPDGSKMGTTATPRPTPSPINTTGQEKRDRELQSLQILVDRFSAALLEKLVASEESTAGMADGRKVTGFRIYCEIFANTSIKATRVT